MMDVDCEAGGGTGSARRRRERRLRMHWRHEQLSLRMALAAAMHHSAQPMAKEEVEGETTDAPRRPKPPLPGTRAGASCGGGRAAGLTGAAQWHRL